MSTQHPLDFASSGGDASGCRPQTALQDVLALESENLDNYPCVAAAPAGAAARGRGRARLAGRPGAAESAHAAVQVGAGTADTGGRLVFLRFFFF